MEDITPCLFFLGLLFTSGRREEANDNSPNECLKLFWFNISDVENDPFFWRPVTFDDEIWYTNQKNIICMMGLCCKCDKHTFEWDPNKMAIGVLHAKPKKQKVCGRHGRLMSKNPIVSPVGIQFTSHEPRDQKKEWYHSCGVTPFVLSLIQCRLRRHLKVSSELIFFYWNSIVLLNYFYRTNKYKGPLINDSHSRLWMVLDEVLCKVD